MNKIDLIKRNSVEITTEDELNNLIKSKKNPTAYLGAAPTGKVHIGYFLQAAKIKDLVESGMNFKYLLADIHAYLDDRKSPMELTKARSRYYKEAMTAILKSLNVDTKKIKFVLGSSFQKKSDYIFDLYSLMGKVKVKRALRASSEVVRQVENPDLGSLNYALMQAIDVHHIGADIALSGIDQRKIYMLAREEVKSLGHNKPICIFLPLIGLNQDGSKMSASDKNKVITIHDSIKSMRKKINSSYCPEKNIESNGLLDIVKFIILPVENEFIISRNPKFGSNSKYNNIDDIYKDYKSGNIHPADLKNSVSNYFEKYFITIQKHFKNKQKIIEEAYP